MTTMLDTEVSSGITMVPLAQITVTPKRYQRRSAGLDTAHAAALAKLLGPREDGQERELDPVDIVLMDDGVYQLAHGHHTHQAYVSAGRTHIPARVVTGDATDAYLLSIAGNKRTILGWPHADRIMTLREMIAQEPYCAWGFGRLADLLGIAPKTVSDEYLAMYPGIEVREVIGRDGKRQMQRIGAGARTAPAPAAPVALEDLEDAYESAGGGEPSAFVRPAAPPVASSSSWSAPAASGPATQLAAPGTIVQIKVPSFVHPTQLLDELNITWLLTDGSEAQWTPGCGRQLPAAVKQRLIKLLAEGE